MINEFILSKIHFFSDDESKKKFNEIFLQIGVLNNIDKFKQSDFFKVIFLNKLNFSTYYKKDESSLFIVLDETSLLGQMTEISGDNVFLVPQNTNKNEVFQLIDLYFQPKILELRRECLNNGHKETSKLIKYAQEFKTNLSHINTLIDFEKELYCALNRSEMIKTFSNYLTEHLEGNFCLYRDFETDFKLMEGDIYVFSMGEDYYYLNFEPSESNILYVSLFISSIFNLLSIEVEEGLNENINYDIDWVNVYELLPIPIVLIDSFGSIRKYNKKFLDLTLTSTQCANFVNDQDVSIKGNVYKIIRVDGIDNERTLIYFLKDSYIGNHDIAPSNEELGIISSSLAHELNNPLGGILAAINVLELDDHTEEVNTQLLDMKKSAKRCKQLVETFLGFSRALPQNYSAVDQVMDNEVDSNVYKAFTQANDLVRFRLIENNLMMNFSRKDEAKFKKQINPSIWAMIIYLIYGEVITTFQHLQLVDSSYKKLKSINCQLREKANEVVLNFDINQVVDDLDIDSGLISHLLDNEKITIQKVTGGLLIKTTDVFLEI